MPVVLITPETYIQNPGSYVGILQKAGFEVRYPRNKLLARGLCSEDETVAELKGAQAVIAGSEHFTARVIESLPELRVIARAGVGYDRVDVAAATRRGVALTITPTSNHEAVAEHAFALMFAVAKNIVVNDRDTRQGGWARRPTTPLRGQTLGVVGLGRIGRSTAVRGLALSMKILAAETMPDMGFVQKHGVELVPLDQLLAWSDFVTIHCPLSDATRGMCNAEFFAHMKPGSVFINTSRGGLVVERDLVAALKAGRPAAAGLDVFEQEPTPKDNPLLAMDNVVVSPHLAGNDWLSLEMMGVESAESIIRLSRSEWPEGKVVNADLKPRWKW
ncbi:MAG: phosphoglycerate dehydrogenase [Planctomycetes bacterium]|nr:phosphoglycerate dehydrogenase [Planctomycetia bacterium]MBI3463769.1 phosphoglycerate dehydrogenase [Planctomycetota bacterium]